MTSWMCDVMLVATKLSETLYFSVFELDYSFADTTDVQNVTVNEVEGSNSITIHCDFVTGSDALGCVVILVGEVTNTTAILNREAGIGVATTDLALPLGCYGEVMAYDIEADGSNGTLPVLGILGTTQQLSSEKCRVADHGMSGNGLMELK